MNQKQKIQQCISDCQQVINELQSLATKANNERVKSTLEESAHHLDMCVRECDFAAKQAP